MTTIFTGLSGDFWKLFSGILLIVLWIFMLIPKIWNHLSFKSWFEWNSSRILNKANKKSGFWWDMLLGLSLGPVFTSCSPTYAIILSIILPISVGQALVNVLFYALWLGLLLMLVGIGWVSVIKRMKWASNPNGWFKKILAWLIVLTWLAIMTGLDKKVETLLLDNGLFIDTSMFEERLLDDTNIMWNDADKSFLGDIEDKDLVWIYSYYDGIIPKTWDTVLFFHAKWCVTCERAKDNFLAEGIPLWINIVEVDYDKEIELKNKYNVLTQTTYVYVRNDGSLIKRRVGWTTINDLKQKIQEAKDDKKNPWELKKDNLFAEKKTAYFAWGCFWCMEWPFESLAWVEEVINGYVGWEENTANYDQVSAGKTKHRESVKVVYDPLVVSYKDLLDMYRRQIDPTDDEGQFTDKGYQYTTAIYYSNDEEKTTAEDSRDLLSISGKFDKPIVVKVVEFDKFFAAEDYHQDYYKKQSNSYEKYKKWSGRSDYIKDNWEDDNNLSHLTEIQRKVTQEGFTETPFENEYWDNKEDWIYVDVIDWTPLFSSLDKFDSWTWWPSFSKPIGQAEIDTGNDTSNNLTRTEVVSNSSDSHLWHIFDDGPEEFWWQRYCINSAALQFVSFEDMEVEGYWEWLYLFK